MPTTNAYRGCRVGPRTGNTSRRLASYLALGAVVYAMPAFAQDDNRRDGDDEIVVTARRVDEKLARVPVAVTVVQGDAVDRLAINTPLDLNKVAGLGGAPIGALTSVNFTIRGQGTAFAGQPGVIPYFAEVPNVPLTYFDLENIQVIKGPQGTLFGQTSTGGVVLFEPKRPSATFGGYLSVEAGNRSYRQFEGAINVPIAGDRLVARVSFQFRNRDGWITGIRSNGMR